MFSKNNSGTVCAVEFGTSKICVLLGHADDTGHLEIVGRGEVPSGGAVIKGEIANMELALEKLNTALDDAFDNSEFSIGSCRMVTVLMTGSGIDFYDGVGTVFISNENQKVTENDMFSAHENARIHQLPPERKILNSSESYFVLDDHRRIRNPLNQVAHKLDAHVHVIHGIANRLENFRSLLKDAGLELEIESAFSPLAAVTGILSNDERDNGVLLVDFGAGTTEFIVDFNAGTLSSGVFQVGFRHVLNDLSVAFGMPVDFWRKAAEDGSLAAAVKGECNGLAIPSGGGKTGMIAADSLEQVIECRLRETFELVREKIAEKNLMPQLGAGAVLTGGGALFEPSQKIFREVFDCPLRIGQPLDAGGAVTGVENPRYSALWGALKLADYYCNMADIRNPVSLGSLLNNAGSVFGSVFDKFRSFRGVFRI